MISHVEEIAQSISHSIWIDTDKWFLVAVDGELENLDIVFLKESHIFRLMPLVTQIQHRIKSKLL